MLLKDKLLIVFACLFIILSFSACAEDRGRVNMQGSIIDSACSIAVENRDQTIYMDVASMKDMLHNGFGKKYFVSIYLVNCVPVHSGEEGGKQFTVTFDENCEGVFFCVFGDVEGVALQISDSSGYTAIPGVPLHLDKGIPSDGKLNFIVNLVANNHRMKVGNYFSSVRFGLDYF